MEEASWDEMMEIQSKLEALEGGAGGGGGGGGGGGSIAASSMSYLDAQEQKQRDDAQDRQAEDMDLRVTQLEGLVEQFEHERQQGMFETIKSVEENLCATICSAICQRLMCKPHK